MDPNRKLETVRRHIGHIIASTDGLGIGAKDQAELAEAFDALDVYLSTGGEMPDDWCDSEPPELICQGVCGEVIESGVVCDKRECALAMMADADDRVRDE